MQRPLRLQRPVSIDQVPLFVQILFSSIFKLAPSFGSVFSRVTAPEPSVSNLVAAMDVKSGHSMDFFSCLKDAFDQPNQDNASSSEEEASGDGANSGRKSHYRFVFTQPLVNHFVLQKDLSSRNIVAKFILPKYWEGQWKDAQHISLNDKLIQKNISIISWNVYFGLRNRAIRMEMMGKVIREHEPDFIFLQVRS